MNSTHLCQQDPPEGIGHCCINPNHVKLNTAVFQMHSINSEILKRKVCAYLCTSLSLNLQIDRQTGGQMDRQTELFYFSNTQDKLVQRAQLHRQSVVISQLLQAVAIFSLTEKSKVKLIKIRKLIIISWMQFLSLSLTDSLN